MHRVLLFLVFLFALNNSFAQDTFSITAVDTITGEVGSAGASCIDESAIPTGCYILSDVKPGLGVIHTQAYWNPGNQNYASTLMDLGIAPEDIIDSLVSNDVQNNPHIRQYGVVDLFEGTARCAAYTGINCDDYKNHIVGPNYTIQGNILLGQEILDSMETRFLQTEGELACKLMAALQGAKVLGADTRCFDYGTSSLSAFLRVAQPLDPPNDLYLDLNVPSTPVGMDPIDSLQTLMDAWAGCTVSGHHAKPVSDNSWRVQPNPSNGTLILTTKGPPIEHASLTVVNQEGKVVLREKNLRGNQISIQEDLTPGLYFYKLVEANKYISRGTFLIQ